MMSYISILPLTLTILLSLSTNPTSSISLQTPTHDFAGDSLLADAHFAGDKDSVQLNRPNPSSFGIILHNTPFNFTSSTSLSSNFTFDIGNGVALVIIPSDFPSKFARNASFELLGDNQLFGIEFDVDECRISSSRVRNVSKIDNEIKGGVKLTSWVDYRAILKRLDVRLSRFGDPKPVDPLISYRIDLGEILKGEEVLLGLASCNEKDEQITSVYSWSFVFMEAPKWVHSMPVDPREHSTVQSSKVKSCVLSGFLFATGCGALTALVLFFVWSYVVDWQKARREAALRAVDFKYEKICVREGNDAEAAMK